MIPTVVTKMVPKPVNSYVTVSVVSSSIPVETPMPPVPVGRGNHFICNYPIYENDPRKVDTKIVVNPSIVATLTVNNPNLVTSVNTPVNLTSAASIVTHENKGLHTVNTGLTTGLSLVNTGLNIG